MAEKYSAIQWVLKELPELQKNGLLDEDSAIRLKEHYEARLAAKPSAKSYFLQAIGIIGGLMIAAGLILIINYNWDMLSKPMRVGVSAIPLCIGMAVVFFALKQEKNVLLNELAAIFTAVGGATLLAMISQIYHIGGEFRDFMMLNLALALPLIYIFNSIGLASVYTFGLFLILAPSWGDKDFSYLTYFWYILLILPYFLYYQIKGEQYRVWTRYLLGATATYGLLTCVPGYYPALGCFAVAAAAWLAGRDLHEKGERFFRNPWYISGYVFLLILLAIGSCTDDLFFLTKIRGEHHRTPAFWLFGGLVFAALLCSYIKRKLTAEKITVAVWLLLLFLPFFSDKNVAGELLQILSCIVMFVLGTIQLIKGYRANQLLEFNAGFLMIAVQLLCRFFMTDYGLLFRAAGFIILGACFISANVILRKKISREVKHV